MQSATAIFLAVLAIGVEIPGASGQSLYPEVTVTPPELNLDSNPTGFLTIRCDYFGPLELESIVLFYIEELAGTETARIIASSTPTTPTWAPWTGGVGISVSFPEVNVFTGRPTALTILRFNPGEQQVGPYYCQANPADTSFGFSYHTFFTIERTELDNSIIVSELDMIQFAVDTLNNMEERPPRHAFNETMIQQVFDLEIATAALANDFNDTFEDLARLQDEVDSANASAMAAWQAVENNTQRLEALEIAINSSRVDFQNQTQSIRDDLAEINNTIDTFLADLRDLQEWANLTDEAVANNTAAIEECHEMLANYTTGFDDLMSVLDRLEPGIETLSCTTDRTHQEVQNIENTLFTESEVYNGTSYLLATYSPSAFVKAQELCLLRGGFLAEVDSPEELTFLQRFLTPIVSKNQYILIGAQLVNMTFVNVNSGGEVGYLEFFPGRPNNLREEQYCVALALELYDFPGLKMDNINCDYIHQRDYEWIHSYLCELPATQPACNNSTQ